MKLNKERTLEELANLDIRYQLLCIQLPQYQEGAINCELKYFRFTCHLNFMDY